MIEKWFDTFVLTITGEIALTAQYSYRLDSPLNAEQKQFIYHTKIQSVFYIIRKKH